MSKKSEISWNRLFQKQLFERKSRLGKVNTLYVIPKYYSIFKQSFQGKQSMTFLELGAGNGEMTQFILKQKPKFLKTLVVTELSKDGVRSLKKLGIGVEQMNAENLKYSNKSFDVVYAFDVMHHVANPKKMAEEMTRVAKKYVFLIEANGISIFRRLLEKTTWYKDLGEKSYFPWQYLSFFPKSRLKKLKICPFLFAPPKIPDFLIKSVVLFSEIIERIPLLNWQCSGVVIFGEKK